MSRKGLRRFILAAGAALFAADPAGAAHLSATWTGTAGSWSDAAQWSTDPQIPNNGVDTFDATIDTSTAEVDLDGSFTIEGFALSSGTLLGSGTLRANNAATWGTGGTIAGAGTLVIGNALTISGVNHSFSGFTIDVEASTTTQWLGGAIGAVSVEGGTFNNAGTFEDHTDDSWTWFTAAAPVFNNSGTYLKLAGTVGTNKEIQSVFNNSGTLHVSASELWLSGGGASGGTFLVNAGASLLFSDFAQLLSNVGAVITHLEPNSQLTSSGTVVFSNFFGDANSLIEGDYDSALTVIDPGTAGEVHFASGAHVGDAIVGDLEVRSGRVLFNTGQTGGMILNDLTLLGGEIGGDDELVILGDFSWQAGTLSGNTLNAAVVFQTLDISGPDEKSVNGRTLYSAPGETSTISGSGTIHLTDADIVNSGGATLEVSSALDIVGDPGLFTPRIFNDGTLVHSTNGTTSLVDVEFNNGGVVHLTAGVLNLAGAGTQAGTFNVSSGAVLEIGGDHYFDPALRITGPAGAAMRFTAGASINDGSINIGVVEISSGQLDSFAAVNTSTTTLGAGTSDIGTLAVRDSHWQTDFLEVGHGGSGTLLIDNDGTVTSQSGYVARLAGSTGRVSINGSSSQWTLLQDLYVGGSNAAAGGAATIELNAGALLPAGRTRLWDDARLNFNGGEFQTGSLELSGGGEMVLSAGADKVIRAASVSIDGAGSSIDLSDNRMIIDHTGTSPQTTIRGYLLSGALSSSTAAASTNPKLAVAYREAAAAGVFGGFPHDATATLIELILSGDSNFDGKVNTLDFNNLAGGFGNGSDNFWINGDFNYDGIVDSTDYNLFIGNYGQSIVVPALELGAIVPEPTGLALIGLSGLLLRRRSRNSSFLVSFLM